MPIVTIQITLATTPDSRTLASRSQAVLAILHRLHAAQRRWLFLVVLAGAPQPARMVLGGIATARTPCLFGLAIRILVLPGWELNAHPHGLLASLLE